MDGCKSMASRIPGGPGLSPEEWARAQRVFLAVLDQPSENRRAHARSLCGDSDAIFDTVQRLVAGHERQDGVFGPPPADSLPLPRILGAWRLVEEIGRGGMGAVYLAERADGQFEKQVAVKLVAADLTPRALERFRQERQILAGFEHPYSARLLDGGVTDDGCPYLVMEYVSGVPVDRYCRERALGVRETVQLGVKICTAVEHAHARGIVHRDIKPANLLITPDGTPKLLDFGISRLLDQASPASTTGEETTRALTPHYASPEQVAGAPATPASDVYSLGILFRDLLAGKGARRISPELQAILAKATAADPAARYVSGKDIREDLERYLSDLPVAAAPRTLLRILPRFLVRWRWQAAAALLVLLCIAAALLFGRQQRLDLNRKIQAIRAVRTLFWDTQKEVSALDGSRNSQRQLIQETVAQLDALGRDAEEDPDLLYELAMAYHAVAYAQGAGGYALGDFVNSALSYQRAISWAQRAVRRGGSVQARMQLALIFSTASNTQLWNSEFAEAERLALAGQDVLNRARAQLLQADSGAFLRTMVTFLNYRGEAAEALGRSAQARELWLEADAIDDGLPASYQAAYQRTVIRTVLGLSNCQAGDVEAGMKFAASAEALAKAATQANPRMGTPMLRKAERVVAECELISGRTREARITLQAVRKQYRESLPHETPDVRTGLADADRILGRLLLRTGELGAAAAVYQDGFDVLSSPPDFAASRIAECNRAELLAGRGRLEQAQAASASASPEAERYWRTACDDYRSADTIFRDWLTHRGIFLASRLAMAEVEKELPKCATSRGFEK